MAFVIYSAFQVSSFSRLWCHTGGTGGRELHPTQVWPWRPSLPPEASAVCMKQPVSLLGQALIQSFGSQPDFSDKYISGYSGIKKHILGSLAQI